MNEEQSRRQFIQTLGAMLVGGSSVGLQALYADAEAKGVKAAPKAKPTVKPYRVSQWTGDDFRRGHELRLNSLPADLAAKPEKHVEFVIVGGGIAGLTSAFYLNDHEFLLLEQYDELGGQSRGGSYRGIDYSYGPAFIDTVEGMYGELYCELGIEPIKLAPGDNSFYLDKKWYQGISGKDANTLYKGFKRLNSEAAPSIKILPTEDTPASMSSAQLARLDSTPFAATLKGYPPQFLALLNSICKSACCGTIEQLSALSGLYLVEDLASSNYVFKGGNPAIAKALIGKLNQSGDSRMVPGAFVWKIELTENGALLMYSDKQGNPHTVSCNHVIVTTPPMVAWRQIKNMDDKMRALLMPMKYGSYLVANCLMRKKLFSGTYDSWFTAPFSIADVTVAETPYIKSNSYKAEMGSVLTVYQPWEPGSEGRTLLLAGDRPKLAKMMRDQVAQFVSQLDSQLEEIVLSRWGHAMVLTGPGYYARLQKIANAQTGPYTLAHNSIQGLPSAESAIRAARFAADRAKQMAAKSAVTVP